MLKWIRDGPKWCGAKIENVIASEFLTKRGKILFPDVGEKQATSAALLQFK